MKHLKLFEAYIKDVVKSFDIDGYKINITDCTDVPGHKAIYTVEERSANGTGAYPVCFSDVELAKDYIKGMIERNEVNADEVKGFLIRKMMLDLDVESKEDNDINPIKIYDYIEKYINVLVDAYLAISTQRYKATFTKDVIRKGLVRLQQECKFNDLSRAKEAIKVFNGSMKPMMDDVLNSKNIETWKLGANGKKYYSVFKDFTTMVNI
jgi:hypothetical protein